MKVAYWPGCVSRGFTPELHGSMELVAAKVGLELAELDRANCCGAGVIAEHNQELADTLNARTFAMAQATDGAELMMNICSTCQGAQSECQERLDASSEYREMINENLAPENLQVREGRHQQELPLGPGRGHRHREGPESWSSARSTGLRIAPFYGCYIIRPTDRLGYKEFPHRDRVPRAGNQRDRRRARRLHRQPQVLRLPGHHDEQEDFAHAGRTSPR